MTIFIDKRERQTKKWAMEFGIFMPARILSSRKPITPRPAPCAEDHLFGLLSIEFKDAPAGHMWAKHLERSAAGINRSRSDQEPEVRIRLPPAPSQQRSVLISTP